MNTCMNMFMFVKANSYFHAARSTDEKLNSEFPLFDSYLHAVRMKIESWTNFNFSIENNILIMRSPHDRIKMIRASCCVLSAACCVPRAAECVLRTAWKYELALSLLYVESFTKRKFTCLNECQ